jgi:hypothetical protein
MRLLGGISSRLRNLPINILFSLGRRLVMERGYIICLGCRLRSSAHQLKKLIGIARLPCRQKRSSLAVRTHVLSNFYEWSRMFISKSFGFLCLDSRPDIHFDPWSGPPVREMFQEDSESALQTTECVIQHSFKCVSYLYSSCICSQPTPIPC